MSILSRFKPRAIVESLFDSTRAEKKKRRGTVTINAKSEPLPHYVWLLDVADGVVYRVGPFLTERRATCYAEDYSDGYDWMVCTAPHFTPAVRL